MAFTYPPTLVGITLEQAGNRASIQANWAGPVPGPEGEGSIHRNTNNVNKAAAIQAYLVTETTED